MTNVTLTSPASRIALATWLSPIATLLFLFSGLYKGVLSSPVDLTVVTMAATVLFLAPAVRRTDFLKPVVLLFGLLTVYLALRLIPQFSDWGIRKAGESALFGLPAIFAGIVIGRSKERLRILINLMAWAGLPASLYVVLYSIIHDPFMFSPIGSGGYQLTGLFLATSLIASAAAKRFVLFSVSELGLIVCGHISGALFAALAIVIIWVIQRDWKATLKCMAGAFALIAIYTPLIAPPLSVMRLAWKIGGATIVSSNSHSLTREQAVEALKNSGAIGKFVIEITQAMPVEMPDLQRAADRLDIYKDAVKHFLECPLIGCGYGALLYAGQRSAHNTLLELAAEGGVIAFTFGLIILSLSGIAAFRSRNPFVIGYLTMIVPTYLMSGNWGARLLIFGFGLAVGSCRQSSPTATQ